MSLQGRTMNCISPISEVVKRMNFVRVAIENKFKEFLHGIPSDPHYDGELLTV